MTDEQAAAPEEVTGRHVAQVTQTQAVQLGT
jgi:hypothetical protein